MIEFSAEPNTNAADAGLGVCGCPGMPAETVNAVFDVLKERRRQIFDKGYDAAHDDTHTLGQLAQAAIALAAATTVSKTARCDIEFYWPFDEPMVRASPRDDLVRATALLIAEIERLDRVGVSS